MGKVQNKLRTSEYDAPASEPCRVAFISHSPTHPWRSAKYFGYFFNILSSECYHAHVLICMVATLAAFNSGSFYLFDRRSNNVCIF